MLLTSNKLGTRVFTDTKLVCEGCHDRFTRIYYTISL